MVAHSDLKVLDPIWTSATITRNHAYMIYDVLFAKDADLGIQPQMAEKHEVSADKLTWTITLRDGLAWHDGTPVTSEDCIASLRRWGTRGGQWFFKSVADIRANDTRTFAIVLKEPFAMVIEALGEVTNVPFIMPKRVAETDPFKQIADYTGSGPFIFRKDEWKPGEKVVYVRNPNYRPRPEPPSFLAGGKTVKVDKVEWLAIPDPMMSVNALLAGEIDLIESPSADLLPLLKSERNIELVAGKGFSGQIIVRFNTLQPPFDKAKARQAALLALAQEDMMRAQVGDPALYRTCNAPFVCGTIYGKEYGDLLIKPDIEKARTLLAQSGYDGTPIVLLHQTDLPMINKVQPVAKQQLEKAGFKVDLLSMDWQTVVTRRTRKGPPSEGGWNMLFTGAATLDADNPGTNGFADANCDKAWIGWPCDGELEKLRAAFLREGEPIKRKALGDAISDRVIEQAFFAPIGQFRTFRAYRKDRLSDVMGSPVLVVWGVGKRS